MQPLPDCDRKDWMGTQFIECGCNEMPAAWYDLRGAIVRLQRVK